MLKWFEQTDNSRCGVVSSRIRLVRNWKEYKFPSKLDEKDSSEMIHRLEFGLKDLNEEIGKPLSFSMLEDLNELDRVALKERRVLNSSIAAKQSPVGFLLSDNEDTGIVFNGDDHIRIQVLKTGLHLDELWEQANRIDDYMNERFPYAFDDRYGYLTAFPTNVGTGLRASVVVHLPMLSQGRKFSSLIGEMGRFGAAVRGVYGEGEENFGALYEVSNQKTLGQTEREIVDTVTKAAIQLANQEMQVRKLSLQRRKIEREDEIYKSYGVLKYARRLTSRDAMIFLSQMMAGLEDGLIHTKEEFNVYRLMLGIWPANLQKISDRPLNKEELDMARAEFIREKLPELN
ncbi:ATP--guanido phosphotransferase [Clostridium boliviensis]|uniref:ATP--guanido phosphotransferase n=2 Tax=Clostridium boliviensis TaxID=318465 RepID=A0ABU4GF94_9CLOT|nr:ATP--guanido phosphotransferase [Clostridium boliviensis]MDW2796299.1 ATP--guanido phosphotransferase [Clostridium boliviensis]